MSISIELREIGPVTVLDVTGDSSIMDGTTLQQTVRSLTKDEKRFFVLNLKGLRHLDSFGLGQLVSTYISVKDHKGDVKIINPSSGVKDLLRYSRIDTVVQVVESEGLAVQELQKLATT